MDAPKPGIYENVADAEYRKWPYPSYSTLALFRNDDLCELEIKYAIEHTERPSDAMSLGLMVEAAIDDPATVGQHVKRLPPEIKARRGAAWQEFQAANPGVEFLPPSEYAKHEEQIQVARDMAAAVHAHDLAEKLIAGAKRQVSFVCDLEFAGTGGELVTHRVKGRCDYFKDAIADLKTTMHGSQRKVGAAWWSYAYDVQSALYTDCLSKLTGRDLPFYFIAVRSCPPYVVTVYNGHNTTEMAGHYLGIGRNAYQMYLEQLAECRATGKWRGFYSPDAPDSRVLDIYLPPWAV